MNTSPTLIDTHCHLDFPVFDADRKQVLERARKVGVAQIIIPATQKNNWKTIETLCAGDDTLHPCYGLHPYWTDSHTADDLDALSHWISTQACVGIGECGLDFRDGQADREKQLQLFEAQLRIATQHQLPIVIHSVNATEDVITLIKKNPGCTGKLHSFSGSFQQAQQLIDLGFYISFGGIITHSMASRHRDTASKIPLSSLMIETNAPDQPDRKHKDERNEPAYLINILACLSELRAEGIDVIAQHTTRNAKHLFKI